MNVGPTPSSLRAATITLALGAAAVLAAVLATWGVGFMQDDWRLLALARERSWVLPEANHLSLPMAGLWWLGDATASPLPARIAALLAHLLAHLVLLPRLARALLPDAPPALGRAAGLLGLATWTALDPLVWACTAAYALVLPCLLGATLLHLAWLERGSRAARAGSLSLVLLGLLTWEFGVAGPPLLALASWARGRSPWRALLDAWPGLLLLGGYAGLKLALGSVEVPAGRGPLRLVQNLGGAPLLLLSPVPWSRGALLSPGGAVAAALACLATLPALLPRRREPVALLLGALVTLLPILGGPGPESRYLYLAVPWAALGLTAGLWLAPPPPDRRLPLLLLLVAWTGLSASSAWRWAAGWREADRQARRVSDEAALAARGAPVVLLDVPDRLPGWGPAWKFPVWRLGLEEALARRGVRVVARAHRPPADPERQGLVLTTPPLEPGDTARWRAEGARVLVWEPTGETGLTPWVGE